ncbi:hypothetical protein DYBT9275_04508 [Dyadobacter sp. CECT 9275]|uniref:Uncharacterized protein n=1 Tax=Dyadobacter helix TaxID=2822344 RepID=A0A916NMY0_9BACT|nr:hypothetical protein [Dyadobacter sp. CECT 9275]CAG5009477.1 hypothetical protein DYBT9275_04508 [Dyadobacter sp. CECT 9275]
MKKLTAVTLAYISLPTFLFLFLWLKFYIAVCAVAALLLAFYLAVKYVQADGADLDRAKFVPLLGSSFFLSFLVCIFSEFGWLPYQSYDYLAHNFKFNMLATDDIPLYDEARGIYMCYYLGNYIVPSLLGKYTSLSLVKLYFFLWSSLGIGLSFIWIQVKLIGLTHYKRVLVICAAVVVGCYVCVIFPVLSWLFPDWTFIDKNGISINNEFVLNQIPVFTRNLSESPQHALPAILGISFLLAVINRPTYIFALAYFFLSTLFLTPFAAIGLSGFMLMGFVRNVYREGKEYFRRALVYGVLLLTGFLPVIIFLLSSEATDMESNRVIWQAGAVHWWGYYSLYLFSAYGIWFVFFRNDLLLFDSRAVVISLVSVLILSLFQIGHFNDLNIRSAIIPQVVLGLSIGYVIVTQVKLRFRQVLFTLGMLFWGMNLLSPVKFFYDRFFTFRGLIKTTIEAPSDPRLGSNYYDTIEKAYQGHEIEVLKQYSLKRGGFFEEYLLKK